jgi:prepilin peptidase CpaA
LLDSLPAVAILAFVVLQLSAAGYDFFTLTIPNPIVYGLIAGFVLLALLAAGDVPWLSHLAAGLIVFVTGAVLFRFNLLGGGDVKLYAASALWIGLGQLPLYLVIVALLGLALALVLLAIRPFLPFLLARLPADAGPLWPRSLVPGSGVPYGVAIAGGAVILAMAT